MIQQEVRIQKELIINVETRTVAPNENIVQNHLNLALLNVF